ncbi:MAG: hypothetical protein FWE67_04505 [Planctomycetaceae bacterium]|nr:hypothetical protein [Planctomycetaceae bacterium]
MLNQVVQVKQARRQAFAPCFLRVWLCKNFSGQGLLLGGLWFAFLLFPIVLYAAPEDNLKGDTGDFSFKDKVSGVDFLVYYYFPSKFDQDTPVMFYMHGINRDPAMARDVLVPYAEKKNLVVLSPLFSAQDFPSDSYAQGNAYSWDADAKRWSSVPEEKWSHPVIERLFSEFQRRYPKSKQTGYYLCGQSAGGQYVHRFPLFVKEWRVKLFVAANAGFYTLPDFKTSWPQGFRNTSFKQEVLHRYLGVPMVLLLGEKDTNTEDPTLSKSERSMQQGPHRFARGQFYYKMGTEVAKEEKCQFGWKIQTVPEAGHGIRGVADAMTTIVREHADAERKGK